MMLKKDNDLTRKLEHKDSSSSNGHQDRFHSNISVKEFPMIDDLDMMDPYVLN